MIGWLIALLLLVLLLIIPLGVRIRYDAGGLAISMLIGPFRLMLYPAKKKAQKAQKEKTSKANAVAKEKKSNEKGGSVKDFLPLLQNVLDFLHDFRRKIRIDHLHLKLILGGTDPYDLSMNYGRGWAVLGNLLPLIEQVFVIKRRNLEIACDYSSAETTVLAGADITITIGRVLTLGFVHGIHALKVLINIMNKRKGGAET